MNLRKTGPGYVYLSHLDRDQWHACLFSACLKSSNFFIMCISATDSLWRRIQLRAHSSFPFPPKHSFTKLQQVYILLISEQICSVQRLWLESQVNPPYLHYTICKKRWPLHSGNSGGRVAGTTLWLSEEVSGKNHALQRFALRSHSIQPFLDQICGALIWLWPRQNIRTVPSLKEFFRMNSV
jgi:hypothetical protein